MKTQATDAPAAPPSQESLLVRGLGTWDAALITIG